MKKKFILFAIFAVLLLLLSWRSSHAYIFNNVGGNSSSSGGGGVTTSTSLTPNVIPIATGAGSLGNSTLSQPGGGVTSLSNVPILDGAGDYIGPNIFMSVTSTAAVGNFYQGGGVQTFTTSTINITSTTFCNGGYINIMGATITATTTITLPDYATLASSTCTANTYASEFNQNFIENNSNFNVIQNTSGTRETITYMPGTPSVLAPGQVWFVQGQFQNSSTLPIGNTSGTFQLFVSLYQTSTPFTVSGNAVNISNLVTITGSQPSTITGDGSKSQIPNLDNILFADSFPGADIALKINNAIASSSSLTPVIYVTASSSFSNTISLTSATKLPLIICAGGVTLTYTGSGTSTIINASLGANALWGIVGCKIDGTNNIGVGLSIGGSGGANNLTVYGTHWTNFNTGVTVGANVNWLYFDSNVVDFNIHNFTWIGGTNSGEGIMITRNLFADVATVNSSSLAKSVYFSGPATSLYAAGNHFDDGGLFIDENGIQNASFVENYFENPNADSSSGYPGYAMMTIASSATGVYNLQGGQFTQEALGATSSYYAAIVAGDSLNLFGVTFDRNGPAAGRWTNAIDESINNANVYSYGVLNENTAYNNFMLGFGGNYPNYPYLSADQNGKGFAVANTNSPIPSFFDVSSGGTTLLSSNISGGGTAQSVSSSPAWRMALSQTSDAFIVQRSPATTTYNPTSFLTVSNTGKMSVTSVASSTILIGASGKPGCLEMYDSVNSTTLEYNYPANGIWITTSTRPSWCQP